MIGHHNKSDSEVKPSESNPIPSLLSEGIKYQLPKEIIKLMERESNIDQMIKVEKNPHRKEQLLLRQQSILKQITQKL